MVEIEDGTEQNSEPGLSEAVMYNFDEDIDPQGGKVYDPVVSSDMAALLFLQLAEAGHEVAQTNLAHMFDQGQCEVVSSHPGFKRFYAQRYYEMSADQGSASSELRLGDYAYNGWSRKIDRALGPSLKDTTHTDLLVDDDLVTDEELDMYARMGVNVTSYEDENLGNKLKLPNEEMLLKALEATGGDMPENDSESEYELRSLENVTNEDPFEYLFQIAPEELVKEYSEPADLEVAASHYWKVSQMSISGEWTQQFVARASFNLGIMYQFGLGSAPDLNLARKLYKRCIEIDPSTVQTPINVVLFGLTLHAELLSWRRVDWNAVRREILGDSRAHLLFLTLGSLIILFRLRLGVGERRDLAVQTMANRRDAWRGAERLMMIAFKKYEDFFEKNPGVKRPSGLGDSIAIAEKLQNYTPAKTPGPVQKGASPKVGKNSMEISPPIFGKGESLSTDKDKAPEGIPNAANGHASVVANGHASVVANGGGGNALGGDSSTGLGRLVDAEDEKK